MRTKEKRVRLTLKTAKALIKQEFGLSGAGLTAERWADGVSYKMEFGRFMVEVSTYPYARRELLSIYLSSRMGSDMRLFYDPETLEENFEAEDAYRKIIQEELFKL